MSEQQLFRPLEPFKRQPNPCIAIYGHGPDGATCKSCRHVWAKTYAGTTYHKCDLRQNTNGAGSDHRLKWDACGRYKEAGQ